MAFSHRYDRKEIRKRGVPGFFAEGCARRPIRARPMRAQGADKGLAHEGPGGPTRALPTRAQGGPQGPGPEHFSKQAKKERRTLQKTQQFRNMLIDAVGRQSSQKDH